jgi:transposase-like protein
MNEHVGASSEALKPRRRFSLEQKADYLQRFLQSGLTSSAFCRQNNLAPSCLQRWLKELEPSSSVEASSAQDQPLFREVSLAAPLAGASWTVELCRPNGTILRLAEKLSPALLEQLLRVC